MSLRDVVFSSVIVLALLAAPMIAMAGGDGGGDGGDDDDDIVTDITVTLYPPPWLDPKIPDYDKLPREEQQRLDDQWRRDMPRRRQQVAEGMAVMMMGLGR